MIRVAQRLAIRAINERGVALYNSGDLEGCTQTYANTIVDILSREGIPKDAQNPLSSALQEAGRLAGDANAQAWVLRGALDHFIEYEPGSPVISNLKSDQNASLLSFDEGMPVKFYPLDDRVMGGSSVSSFVHNMELRAAVFSGQLILQGGGFASVRGSVRWNLSDASCVRIVASSQSGGSFKFRLQDTSKVDAVYHQSDFFVEGDGVFREYDLPLDGFSASWRGIPQRACLDKGSIKSVGFMISKFSANSGNAGYGVTAGAFDLTVRKVSALK